VESITPIGGLFAFLGHQISTMALAVPPRRWFRIGLTINRIAVIFPAAALDRLFKTEGRFPVGYVTLSRKPV